VHLFALFTLLNRIGIAVVSYTYLWGIRGAILGGGASIAAGVATYATGVIASIVRVEGLLEMQILQSTKHKPLGLGIWETTSRQLDIYVFKMQDYAEAEEYVCSFPSTILLCHISITSFVPVIM